MSAEFLLRQTWVAEPRCQMHVPPFMRGALPVVSFLFCFLISVLFFSVIIIIRMASFCGKFTKQAVSSCFTHYWRETVSLHFNHCSGCSNNHRRSNTIGQILNDHGPNSFISVESSTAPLDSPLALRLRGLFAAVSTTERSPTQEFQRPTCPSAPEVAHRG